MRMISGSILMLAGTNAVCAGILSHATDASAEGAFVWCLIGGVALLFWGITMMIRGMKESAEG